MDTQTHEQTNGPSMLDLNIKTICQSKRADSETGTPQEKRLDGAFQAFINRERRTRGWNPIWTTQLRAEVYFRFALHCRELINASGVPEPERRWNLECLSPRLPAGYRELAGICLDLIDNPKLLAVIGDRGRGKSTIAYGLAIKFCELGRPALYCTAAEYFGELTGAPWEKKQEIRKKYFSTDLLVIDEVQVRDADKQFQDNELTTLVDRRYREDRATLILSNLKTEELKKNLGTSIWRRLIETGGDPIETDWERIEVIKQRLAHEAQEATAK